MNRLTADQSQWVESTLAELTLRERIAQMILPMLTANTAEPLSIGDYVAQTGIGGGHMFGGSLGKCRAIATEAQSAAKVPLLISRDFEIGPGERMPEGTHLPGRMAIAATGDEELSYEAGKATALEATAAGYNLAYGPIVDLAAVKDYQRQVDSMGRDPELTARLGAACVRGLQDHGMAACAKHFPGDGFDDRDQHLMTLVNPLSPEDWWANSAVPFKAAIAAGVESIMVSCIGLPSMDPEAGDPRNPLPAIVSKFLVSDLLRKQLGFEGIALTDALNMGGVSYHFRERDRYRRAIEAGNDILIFVRNVPKVLDDLVGCVESGQLSTERIDASCRRVLTLKARLNLHEKPMVADNETEALLAKSPGADVSKKIAERSITLIRDSADIVPLKLGATVAPSSSRASEASEARLQTAQPWHLGEGARVAVVLITNQSPERFSLDEFNTVLRDAGVEVTSVRDPATDAIHDQVAAEGYDAVITALYFPVQFAWNTQRIHGPFSRCIMSGFPIAHPDTRAVWISFSNPNHLYELPFMDPYIVTYGASPAAQRAAARALLGQIPMTGKIPAELDGFFNIGDGVQREAL